MLKVHYCDKMRRVWLYAKLWTCKAMSFLIAGPMERNTLTSLGQIEGILCVQIGQLFNSQFQYSAAVCIHYAKAPRLVLDTLFWLRLSTEQAEYKSADRIEFFAFQFRA